MTKSKILLIDDNEQDRKSLESYLQKHGYLVFQTSEGVSGLEILEKVEPDLVISAMNLPDYEGIELLKEIKKYNQKTQVILISGIYNMGNTIEAMRFGAYDLIEKPLEYKRFNYIISKALETKQFDTNIVNTGFAVNEDADYKTIIGKSPKIKEILKSIGQITSNKVNVLILGESGTGKELISRAIHYSGITKENPFIAVNSAALPETLLESELFGHEKGAFTDAIREKKGKFELAGEGTIFLDEISEISPKLQTKLLRVIQEREFERVGGEKTIPMKARIIAATNKNLEEMVEQGKFRQDLYYRVKVFTINVPPLRERKEDIPALVIHFLQKINKELHKNVRKIPYDVIDLLQHYNWVGNIRELENTLTQAVLLANTEILEKDNILLSDVHKTDSNGIKDLALDSISKNHIKFVLDEVNWDKKEAAKLLKISRQTLYNKIKAYSISQFD